MELKQALEELRKEKKRKFDQTVEIVVNLKNIDLRRDNVNAVISLPHKFKEKKVCGFLTKKNDLVTSITKPEFAKYSEKDKLKELVDEFDFFIAHASLMPSVATTFGKALGPAGKMPSPQLGIVTQETPEAIKPLLEKIAKSVKVRAKEPSIKIAVGKESMRDEDIIANFEAISSGIINALPTKRENVKSVLVKFSMTKPIKVDLK
jgi:large subunit ribosomal protein L1